MTSAMLCSTMSRQAWVEQLLASLADPLKHLDYTIIRDYAHKLVRANIPYASNTRREH